MNAMPMQEPGTYRLRERGVALVVAMIMIFTLALLGVTSLQNSTLESRMVVNSILTNDVLQAAESANEVVLNNQANLQAAYVAQGAEVVLQTPLGDDSLFASEVRISYVGEGNAIGASMNAAQGASSFDALRYVSEGNASMAEVRASRRVLQGVSRNAPSAN